MSGVTYFCSEPRKQSLAFSDLSKSTKLITYSKMKLHFSINYYTHWGQSIYFVSNLNQLQGQLGSSELLMSFKDSDNWELYLEVPDDLLEKFRYYYKIVDNQDDRLQRDSIEGRKLPPIEGKYDLIHIRDRWLIKDAWYEFWQKPIFTETNYPKIGTHQRWQSVKDVKQVFRIQVPALMHDEELIALGDAPELGYWEPSQGIKLQQCGPNEWFFALKAPLSGRVMEYKYALRTKGSDRINYIEYGSNRTSYFEWEGYNDIEIVNDGQIRIAEQFWKGGGIAVPVFSLRSHESWGCGEFNDLKNLGSFCQSSALKIIQVLPINDSSAEGNWRDACPYSAISVFALHPMYLSIPAVCSVEASREVLNKCAVEAEQLNAKDSMQYESLMLLKERALRSILPHESGIKLSREWNSFVAQNDFWLPAYVSYCVLRKIHGHGNHFDWPMSSKYSEDLVQKIHNEYEEEVFYHYFVQFHLHKQLTEAKDELKRMGVALKGDIPIGVNRKSVDTWEHPELFHLDRQAGAPPDAFSENGQNWELPTYNWSAIIQDDFKWWHRRLSHMEQYFDAVRIDHVLGFFRIWQIPHESVQGVMGYFNPAHPIAEDEIWNCGHELSHDRVFKPFISTEVLKQVFGKEAHAVADTFLNMHALEEWSLKQEYSTQRAIESYFEREGFEKWPEQVKMGLMKLLTEVLFISVEKESGNEIHPRVGMQNTFSFKALPKRVQDGLNHLYNDYFYRRQEDLWQQQADQLLAKLSDNTNMLLCAEDLGMLPASISDVLRRHLLLSLEVQRMPKQAWQSFGNPKYAPYLSVVTTGTHDMTVLGAWTEEDHSRNAHLKSDQPFLKEIFPFQKAIVAQHFASGAMWAILPVQDLVGIIGGLDNTPFSEQQINDPSNAFNRWDYRMKLNIQELKDNFHLNGSVKEMIKEFRRR